MRIILLLTALICALNIGLAETKTGNSMKAHIFDRPLIIGKGATELIHIAIANHSGNKKLINSLQLSLATKESGALLQSAILYKIGTKNSARRELIATGTIKNELIHFNRPLILTSDTTWFAVSLTPDSNADLDGTIRIEGITARLSDKTILACQPENGNPIRIAYLLRAAGEDNCHTYRIPGFTTTDKGTLIAVFDNRYENSKDLQGHIDIGMSRSTDGGRSWEPMKVVMDMTNLRLIN